MFKKWGDKMSTDIYRINANGYEVKTSLLWWQKRGLTYTASGYGKKIPTSKMIKFGGRWYRIYCSIFSNNGTCFICRQGKEITIEYLTY